MNRQPVIAYPVFQGVVAVQPPKEFGSCALSPELWGIMEASTAFSIRQHVKILPKKCCACPPCVKQENTYSVYAGLTRDAQAEILRVDEVSNDWNRACCSPNHPWRLETRSYIPIPGDGSNSDFAHLAQDFGSDWNRFSSAEKATNLATLYKQSPVLLSMVRDNGMRCCCKCPCKLLNCCVFSDFCADGLTIYPGPLEDEPNGEDGRPYNIDHAKAIGSVKQPILGGCCTATLHLRENADYSLDPWGKIEAPCVFGGCSEFCCDFLFTTSFYNSPHRAGDAAAIIKRKPGSLAAGAAELFTDADNYSIEFSPQAKLSVTQKVSILAGQLLADYMFFDGNTEKCKDTDDSFDIYCCYCSILGCLVPCTLSIPKNVGN